MSNGITKVAQVFQITFPINWTTRSDAFSFIQVANA